MILSTPFQNGNMKKLNSLIPETLIGRGREMTNMQINNRPQEEEVEGEQEVVNKLEAVQEREEVDTSLGGEPDPHLGVMKEIKNGMKDIKDGMSHRQHTQDMKKIEHKKEIEDTTEKIMMIEDMRIETSMAEDIKTIEDLSVKIDQKVPEDKRDMVMTEEIIEEDLQKQADTQTEDMRKRKEQEAQPLED